MPRENQIAPLLSELAKVDFDALRQAVVERGQEGLEWEDTTLDEAIPRLQLLRVALEGSDESSWPTPMQKHFHERLEEIQKQIDAVNGGTDPSDLIGAIAVLDESTWRYGLANRNADQKSLDVMLGCFSAHDASATSSLRDVEDLKAKLSAVKARFDELSAAAKSQLDELTETAAKHSDALEEEVTKATAAAEAASEMQEEAAKAKAAVDGLGAKVQAQLTQAETHNARIAEVMTAADKAAADAGSNRDTVEEFVESIDAEKARLKAAVDESTAAQSKCGADTAALVARLLSVEKDIDHKLKKATGVSLFDAFSKRQRSVAQTKWVWAGVGILALAAVAVLSYSLGNNLNSLLGAAKADGARIAVGLKLAAYLPLALAIYFSLAQYGRERRLEEEYAFRANISLSLTPYQDYLDKLTTGQDDATRQQYINFIIKSIGRVFVSPTKSVFSNGKPQTLSSVAKNVKMMGDATKSFVPAAR